jgi:hypothetical protein
VADALFTHSKDVAVALPLLQTLREMCEHASLRHLVIGADAIEALSRMRAQHANGVGGDDEVAQLCDEALALLLPTRAGASDAPDDADASDAVGDAGASDPVGDAGASDPVGDSGGDSSDLLISEAVGNIASGAVGDTVSDGTV